MSDNEAIQNAIDAKQRSRWFRDAALSLTMKFGSLDEGANKCGSFLRETADWIDSFSEHHDAVLAKPSRQEPAPPTADSIQPAPEWMMLPPSEKHPNYKKFHRRDDWCPKAGCRPACNPKTICCEGGRFNEPHNCRKQPSLSAVTETDDRYNAAGADKHEGSIAERSVPPQNQPAPQHTSWQYYRCAICGWPLADSTAKGCMAKGCIRGNCSQRPFPDKFFDYERACKEYDTNFPERHKSQPAPRCPDGHEMTEVGPPINDWYCAACSPETNLRRAMNRQPAPRERASAERSQRAAALLKLMSSKDYDGGGYFRRCDSNLSHIIEGYMRAFADSECASLESSLRELQQRYEKLSDGLADIQKHAWRGRNI